MNSITSRPRDPIDEEYYVERGIAKKKVDNVTKFLIMKVKNVTIDATDGKATPGEEPLMGS